MLFISSFKLWSREDTCCINILSSDDISYMNWDLVSNLLKFGNLSLIYLIKLLLVLFSVAHWSRKWILSPTSVLHRPQIRLSIGRIWYLPCSISSLWALILNVVNSFLFSSLEYNKWKIMLEKSICSKFIPPQYYFSYH